MRVSLYFDIDIGLERGSREVVNIAEEFCRVLEENRVPRCKP